MIHLHDFAQQQGVTDRAIQKHLKKYAADLEGLYERKGPNGTWLSDEACEILRSKMKQQPITIMESSDVEKELRKKLEDKQNKIELLQGFLLDAKDEIKALTDEKYALEAQNRRIALLEADNEAVRVKALEAEKTAQAASDELTAIKGTLWYKLFGPKK